VALIDSQSGSKVTFGQLKQAISRLSSGLVHSLKWKKWQVMGIYSPNHMEYVADTVSLSLFPCILVVNTRKLNRYPVVVHAVLKAGGTVTLANPSYTASELAYQLNDAGASHLVTSIDLLPNALEAAKEAGIPTSNIYLMSDDRPAPHSLKFITSLNSSKPAPKITFTTDELKSKPAYLCYSSGTTGKSKGVQTTHRNMVSNQLQYVHFCQHFNELKANDCWVGVLPFYHIYGLSLALHIAFYLGYSVVVIPKFGMFCYLLYCSLTSQSY
jgi:4-coumarate--CoA ligase